MGPTGTGKSTVSSNSRLTNYLLLNSYSLSITLLEGRTLELVTGWYRVRGIYELSDIPTRMAKETLSWSTRLDLTIHSCPTPRFCGT